MTMFNRAITILFIFVAASSGLGHADVRFGATTTPSPPNDKPVLDCTRPNADPRCPRAPAPYYSTPYRQRPVIINQLPPEPAIEIDSLTDDWSGCRKAKLGAIRARNSGHADEANNLDEWLWKNCRSYSNELRQLEQNGM